MGKRGPVRKIWTHEELENRRCIQMHQPDWYWNIDSRYSPVCRECRNEARRRHYLKNKKHKMLDKTK